MRAVLALAVVLALCSVVLTDAKRIHKLQHNAQTRVLAKGDAKTPFEAASAPLINAAALKLDGVRGFFNANVLKIAADQGKPARRIIGTYESVGIARSCNNGQCGEFGSDWTYDYGGKGVITAVLSPASGSTPESISIEFNYGWPSCTTPGSYCMTHLRCNDVGKADTTPCDLSTYMQAYIPCASGCSSPDLYNSAPSLSKSDWPKMGKRNDIRISKAGAIVVREYYENKYGKLRHTIRHIRATFNAGAFVNNDYMGDGPYVATLAPEVSKQVATASNPTTKLLNTAEIMKKFFTEENIDLARMQSGNKPVTAVIGAYSTAYMRKLCNNGECKDWSLVSLTGSNTFGGDGSIALSCTVPQDLSTAQCSLTLTMKGTYGWEYQAFTLCGNVGGGAAAKCTHDPSYFGTDTDNQGRSFWNRRTLPKGNGYTMHALYFTNDQLVIRWKFQGVVPSVGLYYQDLIALSTPLTDFGAPAKTNCLSKATADEVISAAVNKKGLKNKQIVLQKDAVEALIKSAPYKTIDEAILKIKGIGPVNVVYVSFQWNFQC